MNFLLSFLKSAQNFDLDKRAQKIFGEKKINVGAHFLLNFTIFVRNYRRISKNKLMTQKTV